MTEKEAYLARIRYQCRRGMLELDSLLQEFFAAKFLQLSSEEQQTFTNLLDCSDQELYSWLVKRQFPQDENIKELVSKIVHHKQNSL